MNKKRLLKLADLLIEDARNKKGIKFDMGTWGRAQEDDVMSCGTTACAMGLAAISEKFKRAGLVYKNRNGAIIIGIKSKSGRITWGGFTAAQRLFGITESEADWLFTDSDYEEYHGAPLEREVARRIRRVVAGKEKPERGWW